jgi:hypothetical protein
MKEIRLDLDYLASTYGIEVLSFANVEFDKDDGFVLVLEGEKRG